MKITLMQLKACESGLDKLLKSDLPAPSSFRLLGILSMIRDNLNRIEQQRTALVRKYGEEDSESGRLEVKKDGNNWSQFINELHEILQEEIELEGFQPLNVSMLGNAAISTIELESLMGKFIVEDSKQETSSNTG
jgi:hypothetical protein